MRFAVVVLLCAAACGTAPLKLGFGVAVTASFDSSVSDATLATVTQIVISATGDETYMDDDQLMRAPHRTEEFVYRPEASTRRIAFELSAEDASGVPVAFGQSSMIQLDAGTTAQLEITLFPAVQPDAGAPDGSATDAGMDASEQQDGSPSMEDGGFHVCAGLSYPLCEDFEHGIDGEWTTTQVNATLAIGTTYVHSGGHAGHVHINPLSAGAVGNGFLQESTTFPVPNTDFHARAFIYFPAQPPAGALQLIEAQQGVSPFYAMDFELAGGHFAMYDHFASTTPFVQSPVVLETRAWQCVEWAVHFGAPGSLIMSVDGIPLTTAEINDTTTSNPVVDQLFFGGSYTNTSTAPSVAIDFWIDDLVVDPNPIGCSE